MVCFHCLFFFLLFGFVSLGFLAIFFVLLVGCLVFLNFQDLAWNDYYNGNQHKTKSSISGQSFRKNELKILGIIRPM